VYGEAREDFQGLKSMELVGVLTPEDDGGQLSIFGPPQALSLVQQGWDGEEARRPAAATAAATAA